MKGLLLLCTLPLPESQVFWHNSEFTEKQTDNRNLHSPRPSSCGSVITSHSSYSAAGKATQCTIERIHKLKSSDAIDENIHTYIHTYIHIYTYTHTHQNMQAIPVRSVSVHCGLGQRIYGIYGTPSLIRHHSLQYPAY